MPLTEQQKDDIKRGLKSSLDALYNKICSCESVFRRNFDNDMRDVMYSYIAEVEDATPITTLPAVGTEEYFKQRVFFSKPELTHRLDLYHKHFEVEACNVMNMILCAITQMVYLNYEDRYFLIQLMQEYFADKNYEFTENILYIVSLLISYEKIIIPSKYHSSVTDALKQILIMYAVLGVARSRELSAEEIATRHASGFTSDKRTIYECLHNVKKSLEQLDSFAVEDMLKEELSKLPTTQNFQSQESLQIDNDLNLDNGGLCHSDVDIVQPNITRTESMETIQSKDGNEVDSSS